jgi:hypothetical protein
MADTSHTGRNLLLGAAAVLAAVAIVLNARERDRGGPALLPGASEPEPPAPPLPRAVEVPAVPLPALPPGTIDHRVPRPLHTKSRHPPGTRIPVDRLPAVDHGIPLPDGTLLPFLNGMTYAPPIIRDQKLGPLAPVVARVTDFEGFEWWEHADGSSTTSKYQEVRLHDGTVYFDPASFHTARLPDSNDVGMPPVEPSTTSGKAR